MLTFFLVVLLIFDQIMIHKRGWSKAIFHCFDSLRFCRRIFSPRSRLASLRFLRPSTKISCACVITLLRTQCNFTILTIWNAGGFEQSILKFYFHQITIKYINKQKLVNDTRTQLTCLVVYFQCITSINPSSKFHSDALYSSTHHISAFEILKFYDVTEFSEVCISTDSLESYKWSFFSVCGKAQVYKNQSRYHVSPQVASLRLS